MRYEQGECNHTWIMLTTEEYEKQVFSRWPGGHIGTEGVRGCIRCFTIQGDSKLEDEGEWTNRTVDYGYLQVDERHHIQYNSRMRLFMRKPREK